MTRISTPGGVAPVGRQAPGAGPTRRGEGPDAEALGSSSTIVGFHFQSVLTTATGFQASVPIAGRVQLEQLFCSAGSAGSNAVDPYRIQLGLASEVPANQAGMDAAEQVFTQASSVAGLKSSIMFWSSVGTGAIAVTTLLNMNGRRIVCGFYNGDTITVDGYVALVLHRVIGGPGAGDPGFLRGERVVMI